MKKKQKEPQNFMKNEFMWEEPKKRVKLYKNWKLYAIALPAIAVVAGTGSGIYYGVNGHAKQVDLSTLNLNTQSINGIEGQNKAAAFTVFLKHNENIPDLETKVEADDDFISPSYTQNGNLTIKAKAKSGCKGKIAIMIDALGQVSLDNLKKVALIGIENMTAEDAFAAFLTNQTQNLADLRENVTLAFVKPSYVEGGSLVITAKPDTKYTGSIEITINAIKQKTLDSLGLNTSLSIPVTNQQVAFDLFIKTNSEVSDLRDNVQIVDFDAPGYNKIGSLKIEAKPGSKYTGTSTITIPKLIKTDIALLVTNTTIQGTTGMTVDEAFQAFLTANSSFIGLDKFVDYNPSSFEKPSSTTDGSLTITAKPNTMFKGSLTIKIAKTIALNTLNHDAIIGSKDMTQDQAFDVFLKNNESSTDLKESLTLGDFSKPGYQNNGHLTIKAKPNTKYDGDITITITELEKTSLTSSGLNFALMGSYTNKVAAFNAFLEKNVTAFPDLEANVTPGEFIPSDYGLPGSLEIVATSEGKYSGMAKVNLAALKQIDLSTLNQEIITGVEGMTQEQAFNAFLANNSDKDLKDLEGYVSVVFLEPDHDKEGSLVITAQKNTKYAGEITIKIAAVAINLESLEELIKDFSGTAEISGSGKANIALEMFLNANKKKYPDLSDNVKTSSFDYPTDSKTGLLKIEGINRYTGHIDITFSKIPTPTVDQEIVNTVIGIKFGATMGINQTLDDFFEGVINNKEHPDKPHWYLDGQLKEYLNKPGYESLKKIDYDKFEFLGLYIPERRNDIPLTDEYIKENAKVDGSIELRAKFDYGEIKNSFVNFSLSFRA